jgi:glycosyltransferase involved in cell wall biosynthesis
MRIGVNTRLFVKGKMDGIAWFSYEILKRMVAAHPEHEFVFFFDRKFDSDFVFASNIKPVIVHPPARHPLLWLLFFEAGIPKALRKEKIDVFFSPDGWLSLRTKVKTLTVIHDLNFIHYPEFIRFWSWRYYRFFFPRFARRADALATVSEFSKKDIIANFDIAPQKITVTANGVAEDFFEISEPEKQLVRQQLTQGIPYFTFVGTISVRKNILNILQAFERFRTDVGEAKLVFAGRKKYWDKEMNRTLEKMQFRGDVIFTGYLNTSELNRIISSSSGLLYPSFFEGFGVPIVEAFACGVPGITSNVTAMPEVAGDAALYVNPFAVTEITDAMKLIFHNEDIRRELIRKGRERLPLFGWDKPAKDLWQIIEQLHHCPDCEQERKATRK